MLGSCLEKEREGHYWGQAGVEGSHVVGRGEREALSVRRAD